jgi:hypothetical protein
MRPSLVVDGHGGRRLSRQPHLRIYKTDVVGESGILYVIASTRIYLRILLSATLSYSYQPIINPCRNGPPGTMPHVPSSEELLLTARRIRRHHDRATAEYDPMRLDHDDMVEELRQKVAVLREEDRLCKHPSTRKKYSESLLHFSCTCLFFPLRLSPPSTKYNYARIRWPEP